MKTIQRHAIGRMVSIAILIIIVIAAIGGYWVYTAYFVTTTPETDVQVGVYQSPLLHYMPYYVAKNQSYFGQQGLNLTETKFSTAPNMVAGLTSGAVNFGVVVMSNYALWDAQTNDTSQRIVAVAQMVSGFPLWLNVRAGVDSGICTSGWTLQQQIQSLKGHVIAEPGPGDTSYLLMRYMLTKYGLDPTKDVSFVFLGTSVPDYVANFQAGKVDATYIGEPYGAALRSAGLACTVYPGPWKTLPELDATFSVIVSTQKYIDAHPDIVQKFVNAIVKAEGTMSTNPNIATNIAKGLYPTLSPNELATSLGQYSFSTTGKFDAAGAVALSNLMVTIGLAKTPPPSTLLYTTQFVP